MTKTITARYLVTADDIIEYPVLMLAKDGTIAHIVSDPQYLKHETTTLTAAFLDIHTHGALGHDVMSASPAALGEMQRFLATRGVANYLPTTVTDSVENTLRALESLATAIESPASEGEAKPIGIHLEGPFLSHAKRGVHPLQELQRPSIELFNRFQAAARGHISLMTIAPELPGAGDLIAHAASLGVKISIGHSNATAAETLPAITAGASSATHTFNAMRALDHREPGILGTVLDDDRLFAELICDGIHVAPPLVRLWLKAKGLSRTILVTDAMSATGMPEGQYSLAGQPVTVTSDRAALTSDPNTLAGSILTMDLAIANLRRFTNATLAEATQLAAHNPAAMLALPRLTALDAGSPANLNRFDSSDRLIATYLRGSQLTHALL
jgi:N-acetylglucosamine-6-phosphate deacetylase